YLAARRAKYRASVSRPRRRGARWAAHGVVLGWRAPGRRSVERHALPQLRGGAVPAERAGRATDGAASRRGERADRLVEVDAAGIYRGAERVVRRAGGLWTDAGRGLRAGFGVFARA